MCAVETGARGVEWRGVWGGGRARGWRAGDGCGDGGGPGQAVRMEERGWVRGLECRVAVGGVRWRRGDGGEARQVGVVERWGVVSIGRAAGRCLGIGAGGGGRGGGGVGRGVWWGV